MNQSWKLKWKQLAKLYKDNEKKKVILKINIVFYFIIQNFFNI